MAFNRDRNFQRGGFKRDFADRGSRGSVTMHNAVCDKCGKNCEVPFRPTSGKPVYCSDCFDRNRDTQRPSFGGRQNSSERTESFDAVCDECGKNCTVPFRPTEGKPIYCRDCFGDKKNNGERSNERNIETNDYKQQFDVLNSKLDKILNILETAITEEAVIEEEITTPQQEEPIVKVAKKPRASKKAASAV